MGEINVDSGVAVAVLILNPKTEAKRRRSVSHVLNIAEK